jgi:hypothetical protein
MILTWGDFHQEAFISVVSKGHVLNPDYNDVWVLTWFATAPIDFKNVIAEAKIRI